MKCRYGKLKRPVGGRRCKRKPYWKGPLSKTRRLKIARLKKDMKRRPHAYRPSTPGEYEAFKKRYRF